MLDNNIIRTALHLSSIIYDGEDKLVYAGLDKVKYLNDKHTDTQGAILVDKFNEIVYIVFRGTAGDKDIITDARCIQRQVKIHGRECKVHTGFYKAYESVKDDIKLGDYKNYKIITCGHSLGGALATLLAADLEHDNVTCISFGAPRVGDKKFVEIFKSVVKDNTFRFIHENDVVPMVPRLNYDTVTGRVRIDDNGNEMSYMNVWKLIKYWLRGFEHFQFNVFSVKDHFMNNYVRVVTLWLGKQA
jgi:hypothetical protein